MAYIDDPPLIFEYNISESRKCFKLSDVFLIAFSLIYYVFRRKKDRFEIENISVSHKSTHKLYNFIMAILSI